jgi:hypothetical protein
VTNWSITSASHHLDSQLNAEHPVVCGRVEGANPFGSAIFSVLKSNHSALSTLNFKFKKRSVAQSLERTAWDREAVGENPTIPTTFYAAVAELSRHLSSKQIHVGEIPASSANSLPDSVKVARRFVKPHGVGASPTLAAMFLNLQFAICTLH